MTRKSREDKRVKFRCGKRTIILKPIPQALLADAMSEDGKPKPPMKEVKYAGGAVKLEEDWDNEDYRGRLNTWQNNYNIRLLRLCIALGVDNIEGPAPDQDIIDKIIAAHGPQTEGELEMRWAMYLIGDEIEGFLNLAMGQTVPTQRGIEEAEERFPDTDDGTGDKGEDS
jgi:hypothetical protein